MLFVSLDLKIILLESGLLLFEEKETILNKTILNYGTY